MSLIDDQIEIKVVKVSAQLITDGFGIPLIMGDSLGTDPIVFPEYVRSYTSLDAVYVDFPDVDFPEYQMARAIFSQENRVKKVLIGQLLDKSTYLDLYATIKNVDPEFWLVQVATDDSATIANLSGTIEAEDRMFVFSTNQAGILSAATGNIAEILYNSSRVRTYGQWGGLANTEHGATALAGKMLPNAAGSQTWAYQTLSGVTADKFVDTEIANLKSYNMNFYSKFGSNNCTFGGITFGGKFVDEVRGTDWFVSTVQVALANLLVASPKVPYNEDGYGMISNTFNQVIKQGEDQGFIERSSNQVQFPNLADVPLSNKTARLLDGVTYEFTPTGAIHAIKIVITSTD